MQKNVSPPTITEAGERITFTQLVNRLESIARPPHELAALLIHDACVRIEPISGIGFTDDADRAYHVWQIGAAALAALCRVAEPPIYGSSIAALSEVEKSRILTMAGGLSSEARINARDHAAVKAETTHTVLRTICTRSSLQRDFVYQFALTLHLLGVRNFVTGSPGDGFCDPLFQDKYGCTAIEYIEMLLGFWAVALKGCLLRPAEWFETAENGVALRERATNILADISCPAADVSRRVREEFGAYIADGMIQAFFARTPLVAAGDGSYLSAPHPFLRLAAATGALFRTIELARTDAERKGSSKPYTNDYTSQMGLRFETFLQFLLEKCTTGSDRIVPEHSYIKKKSDKSPDFVILNANKPDDVVLVQAKLKRLSPGAFYGFDREDFERDAKGPLAELIWKSLRYIYRLETTPDAQIDPAFAATRDAIRRAKRIMLLGIVPTMPSVFHVSKFRDAIEEGVREHLNEAERQWYANNQGRFGLWHIVESEELATFAGLRTAGSSLFDSIHEYLSLPSFGELATAQGIRLTFRDWFITEKGPQDGKPHRVMAMQQAFNEFCDATSRKFFPPTATAS